ncbi:hypothetical protein BGZ95_009809 [Linnemannia exigua]|uniref:HCP-like protein n=1 Tax=Linnemannia exigua TaxID=604196 RepID=A0AAD4H6G3_9FUNG|nr:hypothetical protein BGZ95_009809 [Linnemannia exigua]
MENELPQVQAVRPVNKDSLASIDDSTTPMTKIMHFDCHVDPTTKKGFILWDDIRLAFSDALYVRHQTKVVPFMKGIDFMPLQPLRIAAIPDVVFDIVVDTPLVRTEAAISHVSSQRTVRERDKGTRAQEEAAVQTEASAMPTTAAPITDTKTVAVGRNPEYGLVEEAMQNYNHIDNPAFGSQPRAPQYIPNSDDDHSNDNESTDSLALIHEQPASSSSSIDIKTPQAPQDHTATIGVKDISPIVMKATLGDADSQVELANMYKVGDGVEQDYEAARYWYLKAANEGNTFAQCSVGDLYRLGLGTDFNHSTALSWYQKAVDQGDASGQCNLGFMYQCGLAVEMDYAVAMDWYRKSADQGHALAQCRIGGMYHYGRGVHQDYSEAMEWYLLAAKQDLPLAHFNVGTLYLGGHGVAKDKDVALEWFRKATSRRDTDSKAQYFMGTLYFRGLGTPQDYSKALEWFVRSAHQGVPEARISLGNLYLLGLNVPRDRPEAMMWFRKAADQHHPDAQYTIGRLYQHGLGVPKNYSSAKEWYAKAAHQEQPDAKKALVQLQQLEDQGGE